MVEVRILPLLQPENLCNLKASSLQQAVPAAPRVHRRPRFSTLRSNQNHFAPSAACFRRVDMLQTTAHEKSLRKLILTRFSTSVMTLVAPRENSSEIVLADRVVVMESTQVARS